MNYQELSELQKDINRMFISGSRNAKMDDRLHEQLQFLRNKASDPVAEKLAEDIAGLLSGSISQKMADKVLEISVYLQTLFYECSATVLKDRKVKKKPQVPVLNINLIRTDFSYLDLKPAMDALILQIPHRLTALQKAFNNNVFNDIRLQPYLDKAEKEKFAEIRNYVSNVIRPSIKKLYIKNNADRKRKIRKPSF